VVFPAPIFPATAMCLGFFDLAIPFLLFCFQFFTPSGRQAFTSKYKINCKKYKILF
jgi:hypothetical protein